jgi:uncharacterized protein
MKIGKIFALIIIAILVLTLLACATPAQPTTPTTPNTPSKPASGPTKVTMISTASGTVPHSMSVAWSTLLTKYAPDVQMSIDPQIGAPQAVIAFMQGQGDIVYNPANMSRQEFPKTLAGKKLATGPLHLAASPQSAVHIVTRTDTGITSISDFKGKKILAKVPTAPANDAVRIKVLEAYGLTDNDIVLLSGNNGAHLAQQLREGVGDAALIFLSVGDPAVVELCTVKDINFLPIPPEKMGFAEDLWAVPGFIPAKSYRGQDKEVSCVRLPVSFSVRNNMDEKIAYTLIKTFYDYWSEYTGMVPAAKEFAIEGNAIAAFAPFHPGAIKYYKEKGVWDAALEAKQQKLLEKVCPQPVTSGPPAAPK